MKGGINKMVYSMIVWLLVGIVGYKLAVTFNGPPPNKYYRLIILVGPVLLLVVLVVALLNYIDD